jgi:uncharacterized alkaline shock family protein YloU
MGIFDRIILTIYTLLLIVFSSVVILMSLSVISINLVSTVISLIYGQWEAGLVAGVFLVVSVRLFWAGLRSRRGKNKIVHHNDMGDVFISLDAVENLVEKSARNVRGVRGITVSAYYSAVGLKLSVRAVISPESSVPQVTAEVQERVHQYIKNTVGVELVEMRIFVDNISNDFKAKHRVQ